MRELFHYIIKPLNNSNKSYILPVYIHHDEDNDNYKSESKELFLTKIGKCIESNIEFIEASSKIKSTTAMYRDQLLYLNSFEDEMNNMKLSFITKTRRNFYTTIKYDFIELDASFSTSTLLLSSFELYIWYQK